MSSYININKNNDISRKATRGLELLREGANVLTSARLTMATLLEGDGTDVSHFQKFVDIGAYPTTADAKASWDDLANLTEIGYDAIAKITDSCARHGI